MTVVTLQRLVDGVFGGSYKALHEWQAEIVGRYGLDFWSIYRENFFRSDFSYALPLGREIPRGVHSVMRLANMSNDEVLQPGLIRRIVAFLALESERSPQSEVVVAFLRKEVVDQG